MSAEECLVASQANVYTYDVNINNWSSLDQNGGSRVTIYRNRTTGLARVLAKSKINNAFVLNTNVYKDLILDRSSETFLQWKDVRNNIYALHFTDSILEADFFCKTFEDVLYQLNNPPKEEPAAEALPPPEPMRPTTPTPTSSPSVSHPPQQQPQQSQSQPQSQPQPQPSQQQTKTSPNPSPAPSRSNSRSSIDITQSSTASQSSSALPSPMQPDERRKSGIFTWKRRSFGKSKSFISQKPELELPKMIKNSDLSVRELVMKEIYTSEYSYLQQLNVMCDVYKTASKGVFSDDEINKIYSNLTVIRDFNKSFFDALHQALDNWDIKTEQMGSIFLKMIDFFKLYQSYCSNYDSALQTLAEIKKKSSVKNLLKNIETQGAPTLTSLLITPVQRIPRYLLLLKELYKETPKGHQDHHNLTVVVERMSEIVSITNKSIAKAEIFKKFQELVTDKSQFIGLEELVAPHRAFVKAGPLDVYLYHVVEEVGKYSWCLLFNDLLVFAVTETGTLNKVIKEQIALSAVWTERGKTAGFDIVTPEGKYHVSGEDQEVWMSTINSAVKDHLMTNQISTDKDMLKRKIYYEFKKGAKSGDSFEGDFISGKITGQGTYTTSFGTVIAGQWNDGLIVGKGKITYANGDVYEGTLEDGQPHGQGIFTSTVGKYEGEWKKGKKDGLGQNIMTWGNGDKYVGQWKADMLDGKGNFSGSDGSKYDGYWKENKRHGQGLFYSPRIGSYDGNWADNVRHGNGALVYPTGDKYIGSWEADKRHGEGTFFSANGKFHYQGNWSEDKKDGYGKLAIQGEYKYEGGWKDDKENGKGTMTFNDGSVYDGEWRDGQREGNGKWKCVNGEEYDGGWHLGKRFGKGKSVELDGSKYDGQWVNDRKEGKGVLFYKNGDSYFGNWKSNLRNGIGVFSKADGSSRYEGEWVNDCKEGRGEWKDCTGTYKGCWKNDQMHGEGIIKVPNGDIYEGNWKEGRRDGTFKIKRPQTKTVTVNFVNDSSSDWRITPSNIPTVKFPELLK